MASLNKLRHNVEVEYVWRINGANVPDRDQNLHGHTRTHRLARGLFVLRYVASSASGAASATKNSPPTVRVAPQDSSEIELICWPDVDTQELRGPGDGLVIRVLRDATIALKVTPSYPGGSVDAELHLEPVSRLAHEGFVKIGARAPLAGFEPPDHGAGKRDPGKIELLAHVARRGDVLVQSGDWICGPDFPMAIEGIEVRWPNRPAGLEIVTRVSINRNGVRDLPESLTGEFAGTRGRAAPITGLEISLTGPRADEFTLRSDSLFLGSSVQSKAGRSISLVGPSAREPLVGLRLSIVASDAYASGRAVANPVNQDRAKAGSSWSSAGRVRVFRGLKKGNAEPFTPRRERV